jgi:hypothetical protein
MPDLTDPDLAVSTLFARAAAALAASPAAAGVTVTTADRANPLAPWSLAWTRSEWAGRPDLMVRRHVDGDDFARPWDTADDSALLATLDQLPELVSRVADAAARAARAVEPESIELIGRDLAGAIGALGPWGVGGGVPAGGEGEGECQP